MRCSQCSRKVGIVDSIKNKCKCGKVTCNKHILDHGCTIQHYTEYVKKTPIVPVVASKMEKI